MLAAGKWLDTRAFRDARPGPWHSSIGWRCRREDFIDQPLAGPFPLMIIPLGHFVAPRLNQCAEFSVESNFTSKLLVGLKRNWHGGQLGAEFGDSFPQRFASQFRLFTLSLHDFKRRKS
jgi:hypothetical protein